MLSGKPSTLPVTFDIPKGMSLSVGSWGGGDACFLGSLYQGDRELQMEAGCLGEAVQEETASEHVCKGFPNGPAAPRWG